MFKKMILNIMLAVALGMSGVTAQAADDGENLSVILILLFRLVRFFILYFFIWN